MLINEEIATWAPNGDGPMYDNRRAPACVWEAELGRPLHLRLSFFLIILILLLLLSLSRPFLILSPSLSSSSLPPSLPFLILSPSLPPSPLPVSP